MEEARRALPLGAVRSSPSSQLLSKLNLIFELRLVLKAIVAREAAQQLAALPVVDDPGDAFACNTGHGGEVDLPDLLTDDDSSRPDFLPEVIRQFEQCSGHPAFERKEATGCHGRVCLAQASSEKPDQRFVELGMFFCEGLERSVAGAGLGEAGVGGKNCRARVRQSPFANL